MNKFIVVFIALLISLYTLGKEEILEFNSFVEINYDNSIMVTESITVQSERRKIKRGIFRDLPLIRSDKKIKIRSNAFRVISVKRNGHPEDYHLKNLSNGIRIYIGHKNRLIEKDIHTFEIRYLMTRHLNFFNEEADLFWNVTGDGWDFDILKSKVTFELKTNHPESLRFNAAYTGKYLEKGQDYNVLEDNGLVTVESTKILRPRSGWSVGVRFPRSEVKELSFIDALIIDLKMNNSLIKFSWSVFSFVLLIALWRMFGKDPKEKIIIPQLDPPLNLSPAQMNMAYLHRNHNDAISSSIVNLAIKGHILIEDEGSITLKKKSDGEKIELSKEESILFNELFQNRESIKLSRSNRTILKESKTKFEKSLESVKKKYYESNWKIALLGIFLVLFSFYSYVKGYGPEGFAAFIGLAEYVAIGFIVTKAISHRSTDSKWKSIFIIFPVGFMLVHGGAFGFLPIGFSAIWIFIFLLHSLPLGFFLATIGTPTKKGQELIDEIEGFKLYLSMAHKEELKKIKAPDLTIELFERFLPYALALGEEDAWSSRLKKELDSSIVDEHYRTHGSWYHSSSHSFSSGIGGSGFASSLGSSITSAMASSTGSSSSGSSGGGGGGGGGGGW